MKAYRVLIFLLSVLGLVCALCFIYPRGGIQIAGRDLRFPSLEEAMTKKEQDKESLEEKLKRVEEEMHLQFVQDSLNRVYEAELADSLAFVDTLNSYKKFFSESMARIACPDNDPSILFPLFDRLDKASTADQPMHILHYGDSQIEQDRITGYIREHLQERFGGWGPGLVPAVQPIPSMSVGQSASDSIPRYIADGTMRQKLTSNRYGILAQMAKLSGKVTLSMASRNWKKTFSHVKKFSKVTLLVGNTGENFLATLSYNNIDTTQVLIEPCESLTAITWQLGSAINSFNLRLSGTAEIYGVSMESKNGVYVDNIPLRGSSGTFFTRMSSDLLGKSMKKMNVKMVMLEFGGNSTPYLTSDKSIEMYKNSIGCQIRLIKRLHPDALVMLIGPADMTTVIAGEKQTYPFLETTIEAMKEEALENGALFWNMYEVMGGRNSMLKWVDHQPAWAGPDYIHFTESGANRIADLFVQSFFTYYDYYQFLKRNTKWSHIE